MFQKIEDYTELLLPDYLLREGSIIEQMVTTIPEVDWTDQVQIIGWLYQYYNTEPKDQVFANLKKNIKITKENIPAATQLFTPDWIVRYMVENSLGRLWLEGHPNDDLKAGWKYYLDEAEQEPAVQAQIAEIRKEYAALKPEDILAIDPCQGSGHILAYMFDVLVQIYEAYGYSAREAASSIMEHNIWGLDIDERAAQLAYFSVMMKARQYDRRFFSRGIQPHVYAILESNNLDPYCIEYFVDGRKELKSAMNTLVKELHDAKEYGSILNVTQVDFDALYARFDEIQNEAVPGIYSYQAIETMLPFVQVAQVMAQKYHAVVTNPPYMSNGNMSAKVSDYIKKRYKDSRFDLYSVFIERCGAFTKNKGIQAMITQQSWMFVTSFEQLRHKIIGTEILSMIHLGPRAFEEISGEVVQTTSFTIRHAKNMDYRGTYCRLTTVNTQDSKETLFLSKEERYFTKQSTFSTIPGSPIAYWCSQAMFKIFDDAIKYGSIADARRGTITGNDDRFLKLWHEVESSHFSIFNEEANKWIPMNKGGEYRKWYGNNWYVVDWENDGYEIKNFKDEKGKLRSRPQNINYFFRSGLTWTYITSQQKCFRYYPEGFAFAGVGPGLFPHDENNIYYMLGNNNSIVYNAIMKMMGATTISLESGEIERSPIIIDDSKKYHVDSLVKQSIELAKNDWDYFETSWDFQMHPLIRWSGCLRDVTSIDCTMKNYYGYLPKVSGNLELCYMLWQGECEERFNQLKANEEELNRIFIDIYGLQNELTPEVEDKDVTVRKADLQRDIRSFISYAVGCMFGRYSLNTPGLAYAGGGWDESKYVKFHPDKDGIIPICDDEYFEDDIVGRFIKFVEVVYGKDSLEDNLRFIADALGGKGSSREVIRNYFINDFYADHMKGYQKRPIYWLFDSGKKNGFKCLIYMHRYQPDTIARIRTDYVHEQQSRYRTAIADLESRVANAGTGEHVKQTKRLDSLKVQAEELRVYEEKIHHLADQMIKIDLDDGVKVNYAKFQDVLAKIK